MYGTEQISNQKIIAMIIGLVLFAVAIILIYVLSNKDYENVKLESDKNYVYAKKSIYSKEDKNIPYINVKGETAKKYNEEIKQIEENFMAIPENKVGFVFNKSGKILSVSIKMINYNTSDGHPKTTFRTFLLNLDTKKAYTKEEIYADYGVNDKMVEASIKKRFKKMYKDVVKKGYVDPNYCDYQCFLRWRGVKDNLEDAYPYIENRTLIFFKGFQTESVFGEEDYFTAKDFKFEVERKA